VKAAGGQPVAGSPPPRHGLLVGIGPLERNSLEFLGLVLPEVFELPFVVHGQTMDGDAAYDPLRRQWNAAHLLRDLDLIAGPGPERVLGVTAVDLFIPILTFVFGLAHLGQRCAVVSLHRLRSEFYGLSTDSDRLMSRLEKEAIHELGHTYGLVHSPEFDCVMHYSNDVDQVDLKSPNLCLRCRTRTKTGISA